MASLTVTSHMLRLRTPLRAAWGELAEREVFQVRIDFGDGDFGLGEAAPLEGFDGISSAAVRSALDAYGAVLARASPRSTHAELLAACAAERPVSHALAAVDLALWDRAGRRTGFPVAQLIAAGAVDTVAVNATLRASDRAGAAEAAAQAAAAGFKCVKLKVGIGDDAGRVAAVRAAVGDAMAIRVDANGAWTSVDEALANLRALAPAGIELCEEPIHGVEAMREVRAKSPVPLAMDETAAERGAPGAGAADAVSLKIGRSGGISGVLRDARAARAAGTKVYVTSNFDGPLGVAAGLHAAAGLRASGPVAYCGLATLAAFEGLHDVLAPVDGAIVLPAGPGLLGGHGGLC
jgi:L-alanine-DL-glutamate epimerase-like enolase superfamily enzyme